jgi:hypothetical protein
MHADGKRSCSILIQRVLNEDLIIPQCPDVTLKAGEQSSALLCFGLADFGFAHNPGYRLLDKEL